jgi:hypothetical protein
MLIEISDTKAIKREHECIIINVTKISVLLAN